MARLSVVPGWVRRPVAAVSGVEDFLLRLFRRVESPEALGGYSALSWLGAEDGADTVGPLVWRAPPEERFADAFLAVADALAEGGPYPSAQWWRTQASCLEPMSATGWAERAVPMSERFYAHGVVCALGWVLGVLDDPALMAPLHTGDGRSVGAAEREEWKVRLRACAIPPGLAREGVQEWLRFGPAGADCSTPVRGRTAHSQAG